MTLEREIYSIETANINKETLDAMKNAGSAMKQIHAGLTIDKVDNVMFVPHQTYPFIPPSRNYIMLTHYYREDLREQHAIGEEISDAITSGVTTGGIDEDELDEELAELQQEKLDEEMLKTGNVPVNDTVAAGRLPAAPNQKLPQQRVEEDDEEEELRKLQAEMAM
jgi:charged multivesicular body protein 4